MAMSTTRSRDLGQTIGQVFQQPSRIRELEARVLELECYLTTQHAITEIIAGSSELESALPRILQAICETTGSDFGEVWSIDRSDNRLHCAATWCTPTSSFPRFAQSALDTTFEYGKGLPGRVWSTGKPAWMTNVIFDPNFVRGSIAKQDGLRGGFGIPIHTEGEMIGAMTFFSRQPRLPDRELLRMLYTVGSQIGMFIERKRVERAEREQARMVAAMEERQRLARDLHDSVTQALFSASVIAEMLPMVCERNPDQLQPNLDELRSLTSGALTEMRAMLVELRPPALVNGDLGELLKNLTDTLHRRSKIQVQLDVQVAGPLSADEQIALYRITQEALHNVTKYAAATEVSVWLIVHKHQIELEIADNGRGFDPMCVPIDHFGIQVMRERAEAMGAAFQIASAPGKGTQLRIFRACGAAV